MSSGFAIVIAGIIFNYDFYINQIGMQDD